MPQTYHLYLFPLLGVLGELALLYLSELTRPIRDPVPTQNATSLRTRWSVHNELLHHSLAPHATPHLRRGYRMGREHANFHLRLSHVACDDDAVYELS